MADKKEEKGVKHVYSTDSTEIKSLYHLERTNSISLARKSSVSLTASVQPFSESEMMHDDKKALYIDAGKNVITKTDVEQVLGMQFQLSMSPSQMLREGTNLNDMKLSYHNLNAFQAYERAKQERIKNLAKQKYGVSSEKDSLSRPSESTSLTTQQLTLNTSNLYNVILNAKCNPKVLSCNMVKKTRRLAEALMSNLEEIKFFAGGSCDICGRDSCDGFNHYPKEIPVEKVIQVVSTDIDEATTLPTPPDIITETTSDLMLPSSPAYGSFKSAEDITSIYGYSPESSDKDSPESSDKEDVFQSFGMDDTVEFPSTLTIYFKYIELEMGGLEYIEFANRASKGFRLKYFFLMYKEAIEFEILVNGITISIDYMKVHPFSMNPIIYQYLRNCCLHIELYEIPMNIKRKPKFLGNCNLCFEDLLSGEKKLRTLRLLITDEERIAFVQNGKITELGYLYIDTSLETDEDQLNNLAKSLVAKRSMIDVMGNGSFSEFMENIKSCKSLTRSAVKIVGNVPILMLRDVDFNKDDSYSSLLSNIYEKGLVTEAEQKAFTDALQLVLVRNKALRTRQSEIDTELNDRAEWMHEELKWRLTLQEHAILSGKDPDSVRWRQWRDENTSDVRIRTIMDDEREYEPAVVITVQHLELFPMSQVMLDDSIKLIYIEYAFLTHSGLELETKSLLKTTEGVIVYNFVKKFDISIDKENLDTQVLAENIKTNQSIKFTAVHEPIERQEELQTCTALGSCEINLFNLAQYISNTHEEVYPLKNTKTGAQDIGYLKIRFDGVRAMRTVALTLLAPSAFRIYK